MLNSNLVLYKSKFYAGTITTNHSLVSLHIFKKNFNSFSKFIKKPEIKNKRYFFLQSVNKLSRRIAAFYKINEAVLNSFPFSDDNFLVFFKTIKRGGKSQFASYNISYMTTPAYYPITLQNFRGEIAPSLGASANTSVILLKDEETPALVPIIRRILCKNY